MQQSSNPFASLDGQRKGLYSATLLHEVGHAVMEGFTPEEMDDWATISKAKGIDTTDKGSYLTIYSKENEFEDFSEHFSAFIFHAQEFRDSAKNDPEIKEKYDFIKKVFERRCKRSVEYSQISPFTLKELEVFSKSEIERHSAEEAVEISMAIVARHEVEMREKVEKLVVSTDGETADDILTIKEVEDNEDPYDQEIEQVIIREQTEGYRRNAVADILDALASSLPDEDARRVANRVYGLLEDDDIEGAMNIIDKYADDDDQFDEICKMLTDFYEDIKNNQNKVRF